MKGPLLLDNPDDGSFCSRFSGSLPVVLQQYELFGKHRRNSLFFGLSPQRTPA